MNQKNNNLVIKTSKSISYWFILPSLLISCAVIKFALQDWYMWVILPVFLYGLWLGLQLWLHPKLLIKVEDEQLWLYEGSLIHESKPKIKLPFELIESFDVQMFKDNRGASWFLTLQLKQPVQLPESAKKAISNSIRFTRLEVEPKFIPWGVNWPEGGAKNLKQRLEEVIILS
mgnify:CR=1 FL=1